MYAMGGSVYLASMATMVMAKSAVLVIVRLCAVLLVSSSTKLLLWERRLITKLTKLRYIYRRKGGTKKEEGRGRERGRERERDLY